MLPRPTIRYFILVSSGVAGAAGERPSHFFIL